MAEILTRYGHSHMVDPDSEWITSKLLRELRTEQFEEPDDEHTQVSVSNEHWSVTVQVSGLVIFDNIDLDEGETSDLPETMYLRNLPDSQLIALWKATVRGDRKILSSFHWQSLEDLPPFQSHYYRSG